MEEATKLIKDIIAELAKDAASFLTKKIKEYFVDVSNKDKIDIGEAYEEYLTKVYDTYSKSKSFVYVNEERDLSSFFQPVDLETKASKYDLSFHINGNQPSTVSTENISEVLSLGSKIIVTGSGGTGKTILMKHFCTNSIKTENKIPVLISLRWFNDIEIKEETFEKLVFDQLRVFNFKLPYKYFLYSLEGNRYLFLFDGFDEIKQERVPILSHMLSDFTKKYRENYFIISSRPDDRILGFDEYKLLAMCPLSSTQIKGLIDKLEIGYAFKKRFIDELNRKKNERYKSFISIPLLLSILFVTYVEKTTIPESLNDFYEEAFVTLLYRHDRKKEGLNRVLKSGISYKQFRKVFERFCFSTFFDSTISFSDNGLITYLAKAADKCNVMIDPHKYASDLEKIACMIIKDGREYIFTHRSFQEYFAAYYASQGSDEQQRNLLLMLLGISYNSNSFERLWHDYYVDRIGYSEYFIDLLRSIESDKVDYLLVWSLVKKIYMIYLDSNKDLLNTASKIFIIYKYTVHNRFEYVIFPNQKVFDMPDYRLLSSFVFNVVTGKYLSQLALKYEKKAKDYKPGQFEDIIPVKIYNGSIDSFRLFESTEVSVYRIHMRAMGYVMAAIDKYNILLPKSGAFSSRKDFIDNY